MTHLAAISHSSLPLFTLCFPTPVQEKQTHRWSNQGVSNGHYAWALVTWEPTWASWYRYCPCLVFNMPLTKNKAMPETWHDPYKGPTSYLVVNWLHQSTSYIKIADIHLHWNRFCFSWLQDLGNTTLGLRVFAPSKWDQTLGSVFPKVLLYKSAHKFLSSSWFPRESDSGHHP